MGKKIVKSTLLILNLSFLMFTIYLFFITGKDNTHEWKIVQPTYNVTSGAAETFVAIVIRIISIVLLILVTIFYFDKKKRNTLVHIIILLLTIITTLVY